MANRRRNTHAFDTKRETEDAAGAVYYVRLKTMVGPLYKLGFTTQKSVEARLSFQGKGHERLIERTLAFKESNHALSIEKKLHQHFRARAVFPFPEEGMPLFGNGQSELYVEDILGLDPHYDAGQAAQVHASIMVNRMRTSGRAEAEVKAALKSRCDQMEFEEALEAVARTGWVAWLLRLIKRVNGWWTESAISRAIYEQVQNHIDWLTRDDEVELKLDEQQIARINRQKRLVELKAEAKRLRFGSSPEAQSRLRDYDRLVEEGKQFVRALEAKASFGPHHFYLPGIEVMHSGCIADYLNRVKELKPSERELIQAFDRNLHRAFDALKRKNIADFEEIVDLGVAVHTLMELRVRTISINWEPSFKRFAESDGLTQLASLMTDDNEREQYLKPAVSGLIAVLRHWVAERSLLSDKESVPFDPVYFLENDFGLEPECPIWDSFGVPYLRDQFGPRWEFLESTRRAGPGWAECDIRITNPGTDYVNHLTIRATPIRPTGRIALAFPNFFDAKRIAEKRISDWLD